MTAELDALANDALDISFIEITEPVLRKINAKSVQKSGQMQQALKALDVEAQVLEDEDLKFVSDNDTLLETMDVYEDMLREAQIDVVAVSEALEVSATQLAVPTVVAKLFPSRSDELLDQGVNPILADPTAAYREAAEDFIYPDDPLDFFEFFTDSLAWDSRMELWGAGYAELSTATLLKGISSGWGPTRIVNTLRNHAESIPARAAQNLLLTLQLTSYRDAQLMLEQLNGQLLRGKIRMAVLDNRTCLNCISLHGTFLAVGERVDDHYRGRCTAFYQVPGGPDFPETMQADSEPGVRRFVPFQQGPAWFDSLSTTRQAQQNSFVNSPGKLRFFQAGNDLSSFEGVFFDDIFGRQTIELSLKAATQGAITL